MYEQIADELLETVDRAAPRLREMSAAAVSHRPAPDRWTIQEVVGHLVDPAANNHQRFVRGQFVDPLVYPKYEQNAWVGCQKYDESDWFDLVTLWQLYNRHLAQVMRAMPAASSEVRCTIGDYESVTLGFLVEDYLTHLRHHLAKIWERTQ